VNHGMCSHESIASKDRMTKHLCAECVRHPDLIAEGFDRALVDRRAAVRPAERLSIRNDLGTMDTHVVAIHVSSLSATLTYTDTHRSRAALLRKVLEPYHACRKTKASAPDAPCELRAGLYPTQAHVDPDHYVKLFGSHLVFRINRDAARKQLERAVKRADTIVLLRWAAAGTAGQCAVLQEGDVHLICTAVARAGSTQMRLGSRLDHLLGSDATRAFFMSALGIVTTGLMHRQSLRLINDDIESALLGYLESTDEALLTAAFDHAMLASARLDRIRGALIRLQGDLCDARPESAHLADNWEKHASDIAARSSRLRQLTNDRHRLHPLLTEAGAVAEALEQAAFKLTFMPRPSDSTDLALLDTLADLVSHSASEYVRCLEVARHIRRTAAPARCDLERFLLTIDRLADLETRSGAAATEAALLQHDGDPQRPMALLDVARALRHAIESLARCSLIARDYVFSTTAGDR
jgi:hypothetical protein